MAEKETRKPGDPDPPVEPPIDPNEPIPEMPRTASARRDMLDHYSASHDQLTPEQIEFYDELAAQVAIDEDAVTNEIGKDPDVNPPEVYDPTPIINPLGEDDAESD
jgi:hypothetical protein